jgi:hypothetical protein
MKTIAMKPVAAFLALALVGAAGAALAPAPAPREKADLSPDQLLEISTHVIVGEVKQVWTREESSFNWDWTRHVAEIAVEGVEKGEGLAAGELVYVRYWTKRWDGFGAPPPDTNGHRGLPKAGERVRAYLARDAYDGFGKSDDGGFNVIGANGFAKP